RRKFRGGARRGLRAVLQCAIVRQLNLAVFNQTGTRTEMEEFTAQGNDEHLSILHHNTPGWIEVIAGSMFSGKSEELIRRLRRAKIARQKVQVFKPAIDNRFSTEHIVSHSEMRHESGVVETADEILARVE